MNKVVAFMNKTQDEFYENGKDNEDINVFLEYFNKLQKITELYYKNNNKIFDKNNKIFKNKNDKIKSFWKDWSLYYNPMTNEWSEININERRIKKP
jgi:phage-related tail protein